MSINLDDLFDTRPVQQQQQQQAAPVFMPPPPPFDPPPPPMIQQNAFGIEAPPPPPPALPPSVPTTTTTSVPFEPQPNYYTQAALHPQEQQQQQQQQRFPYQQVPVQGAQVQQMYRASNASMPAPVQRAQVPVPENATKPVEQNDEDEDKKQLEKIIQLRKELEREQERERKKREELETWGCPSCTYRNALELNVCQMCESKRPGYNPPASVSALPSAAPSAPAPMPKQTVVPHTAWNCGVCFAPNTAENERCMVCQRYRNNGTSIDPACAKNPMPWLCSMCGRRNGMNDTRCPACNSYQSKGTVLHDESPAAPTPATDSKKPTEVTTWQCSVCTLENPVSRAVCEACQSGQRPRHLSRSSGHTRRRGAQGASDPSIWGCPACTFLNAIVKEKCDVCGAQRPAEYKPPVKASAPHSAVVREKSGESDEEIVWQDDEAATECNRCRQPFNFTRRRHHCRACGFVFCATCSPYQKVIKPNGIPERLCVACFENRK